MFALDPEQDFENTSWHIDDGNDDRRVQQLRQLLLSQFDLIQKQADVIVAKDQQIKDIRNENETLKLKVAAFLSPPAKTSTLVSGEKSKKPKVVIKEESIEEIEESEEDTPDEDFFEQMETEEPYFTLQNEIVVHKVDEDHDLKVDEKKAEVLPGWRLKPISPSYIMEGTENIEDETILKRHQKPETDEKRRKRLKIRAFVISRLLNLV